MERLISARTLMALIVGTGLATAANADTIYVCWDGSGDYLTIQEGINAASNGEEVIVCDGTYTGAGNKDLDFGGKAIIVRSENGAESCIIDCEGSGSGFFIQNGETSAAVVDGFTITGGNRTYGGGVTCINGSDPTIKNCIITGNHAGSGGGGVNSGTNTGPTIVNCIITGNTSNTEGGGVRCHGSTATIVHCTIANNDGANDGSGNGGGVHLESSSNVVMANCVLWGNTASQGPEANVVDSSTLTISYADVDGGLAEINVSANSTLNWGDGMIDADPQFVDPNNGDYHLWWGSPCIDSGTNDPPGGLPAPDFEGDPRPTDGDGDVEPWTGQAETADMGADETATVTTPVICLTPTEFEFFAPEGGPDPNDQTLWIWNCGVDTLNWEIVESCDWLSADPNSGDSTGEIDDVALSVSVAGLSPGVYDCALDVIDPSAANSPRTADVTLYVCGSMVYYVDDDAPLGGDGTSWNTAHKYLQDALYLAAADPCITEIRIAGGTYYADEDEAGIVTPGNRAETFQLLDGVTIVGGYRGLTGGGDPNDHEVAAFETVLSGDIGVADNVDDNSYHVVTGSGTDASAILDGVTVADGCTDQPAGEFNGGGVYIASGSPTLRYCTIRDNQTAYGWLDAEYPQAGGHGAGLYCNLGSPTLIDCVIRNNQTHNGYNGFCEVGNPFPGWEAGDGGGLYLSNGAPVLIGCSILDNSTGRGGNGCECDLTASAGARAGRGAGICLVNCPNALFVDCTIAGNSTGVGGHGGWFSGGNGASGGHGGHGGGLYLTSTDALFVNCSITGNGGGDGGNGGEGWTGDGQGGDAGSGAAVYADDSAATLTNCTIVQNIAGLPGTGDPNGAEGYGGIAQVTGGTATIANCIFWGNVGAGTTEEQQIHGGSITVDYSCVEGWTGSMGGTGNIGDDPSFSDPNSADYHLTGGSPCIDAADNTAVPADVGDVDNDGDTTERTPLDLDGLPRFVDDPSTADTGVADPPDYPQVVDMGAYEFGIACDLDGDCDVDLADLAQLLSNYGTTTGMSYEDGDVDNDSDVDLADLAALLAVYGTTCR